MLTRLVIDGFKNILGMGVDLGPFTCIAGPNGTGKSNFFDAIEFLSLLADHPLMEAAQRIRSTKGRGGDPRELFWTDGVETSSTMSFAAEIIVPQEIRDDFGRVAAPSITFLRYEIEIGYEPPSGLSTLGRLVLVREELRHIKLGDAHRHMRFSHSAKHFRSKVVTGRRSGIAFISTVTDAHGDVIIQTHQDGGSRGQPRPSPALTAPRTIVSTVTTSSDPTILAARREFQSWRLLALEPSAMRSPDQFSVPPHITSSGAHLAAALYRLASGMGNEESETDPQSVYATIASKVAALVGVESVRVDRDERRELLTLELREEGRDYLPARSLSDGTLRFLALCLLDSDPQVEGLICMEEPENGIHPARMQAMVELVRGLSVDANREPGRDNVIRQVVVNTHSPVFVKLQQTNDLLFAEMASVPSKKKRPVTTLRLRPLSATWRCYATERGVGLNQVLAYLTDPPGTQVSLPNLDNEFESRPT
jgi:predicted ATPase